MIKNNSCPILQKAKSPQKLQQELFARLKPSDLKKHPILRDLSKYQKRPPFDFLSKELPKINFAQQTNISIKKNISVHEDIEVFKQIYYENCRKDKLSRKIFEKYHRENDEFTHQFRKFYKKNNDKLNEINDTKFVDAIEKQYTALNYKIPKISSEHNIFKPNPLLSNDKDLCQYYRYNRDTTESTERMLRYLTKINDSVFEKMTDKMLEIDRTKMKEMLKEEKKKEEQLLKKDINKNKTYIERTTETVNNIDDLDEFFVTRKDFHFKPTRMLSTMSNQDTRRSKKIRESIRAKTRKATIEGQLLMSRNKEKLINHISELQSRVNTSAIENIYDDIKKDEIKLQRNNIFFNYNKFKSNQSSRQHSQDNSKNIFHQMKRIKEKLIKKDLMEDNYKMRNCKAIDNLNIPLENSHKNQSKKIKSTFMKNEHQMLKLVFELPF